MIDVATEYAVVSNGLTSETHAFVAGSADAAKARVALIGDLGFENARSVPPIEQLTASGSLDALFHVGDLAYDLHHDEGRMADRFLQLMQGIAARIPYQVLPGNHEEHNGFAQFDSLFSMVDSRSQAINNLFYSVNLGPLHVVSVTNEFYFFHGKYLQKELRRQHQWLEADLAHANQETQRRRRPWILVLSHRPMYCSSAEAAYQWEQPVVRDGLPGSVEGMEQLMQRHNVDLYVSGHMHVYERTHPVFQGKRTDEPVADSVTRHTYKDPKSPIHIVTGAAGCEYDVPVIPETPAPAYTAVRSNEYSFTRIDATRDRLHVRQIHADNSSRQIDEFIILKTSESK